MREVFEACVEAARGRLEEILSLRGDAYHDAGLRLGLVVAAINDLEHAVVHAHLELSDHERRSPDADGV